MRNKTTHKAHAFKIVRILMETFSNKTATLEVKCVDLVRSLDHVE
jgi:hypothetical protein